MKSEIHTIRDMQLNDEKNRQIKGKSAKIAAVFMQNKANFVNSEIGISSFETSKYEISPAWRGKKQTQSNPKQSQYKPNSRKAKNEHMFYYNNELQKFSPLVGKKTNPIQSQFKLVLECRSRGPNFKILLPKMFDMRTIISNNFNL